MVTNSKVNNNIKEKDNKSKEKVNKSKETVNKSKETVNKSKEKTNGSKDNLDKIPSEETLPNPNFCWGYQEFSLENGDDYSGGYCCHKSGIIWREGEGTYTTKDNHKYSGKWENDQLLDSPETAIIFSNNDEYFGNVKNGKYSGEGVYTLSNKLIIKAEFENNKPVGEMTLIDYEGHSWKGTFQENNALLLNVNHFFDCIPPERGIGEPIFKKELTPQISQNQKVDSSEYCEEIIFAKSQKTKNDFEMSNINIATVAPSMKSVVRRKRSKVMSIITRSEVEKKPSTSVSLLKVFLSKKYRTQNWPLKVFTPTCDIEKELQNELNEDSTEDKQINL